MSAKARRCWRASSRSRNSRRLAGTLARRTSRKKSINIKRNSCQRSVAAARHERQLLQQVHVLLVLYQCAIQRRQCRGAVFFLQCLGRQLIGHQQLQPRSEEHTSELQSRPHLVCRLLLEKKKQFRWSLCG